MKIRCKCPDCKVEFNISFNNGDTLDDLMFCPECNATVREENILR